MRKPTRSKISPTLHEPSSVANTDERGLTASACHCRKASHRLDCKLAVADKQMSEGELYDHVEVFGRLRKRLSE